jgi:hypothetical protein
VSGPAARDAAAVGGVPESSLAPEDAARLPPTAPPAPWTCDLRAVVWWHRATGAAAEQVPPALRRRVVPVTLAAFVRYADTPVGPYSEVLASPVLLATAAHIPFIAVDSLASVLGGRANWALPKTVASFAWDGPHAVAGSAEGWRVEASAAPRGPRLPLLAPARDVQLAPDGARLGVRIAVRGLVRAARVEVDAEGPTLSQWLRPGTHRGVVVDRARLTFGAPRATRP